METRHRYPPGFRPEGLRGPVRTVLVGGRRTPPGPVPRSGAFPVTDSRPVNLVPEKPSEQTPV
jgi:hypothetical protein